jgi:hypothetical protein
MLHLGLMKLSEENKDIWTAEDEATFWPLYRKWERLRSKRRNNKTRVKKFGARTRDTIVIPIEKTHGDCLQCGTKKGGIGWWIYLRALWQSKRPTRPLRRTVDGVTFCLQFLSLVVTGREVKENNFVYVLGNQLKNLTRLNELPSVCIPVPYIVTLIYLQTFLYLNEDPDTVIANRVKKEWRVDFEKK